MRLIWAVVIRWPPGAGHLLSLDSISRRKARNCNRRVIELQSLDYETGDLECANLVLRHGRGRGCGGVADDEARGDEKLALQLAAVGAIDLGVEGVEGSAGQVGAREADCCERRKRVLSECNVVQTDHGKILRNAEALSVG